MEMEKTLKEIWKQQFHSKWKEEFQKYLDEWKTHKNNYVECQGKYSNWLVGWLVWWFYGVLTFSKSFNAELSLKQFI